MENTGKKYDIFEKINNLHALLQGTISHSLVQKFMNQVKSFYKGIKISITPLKAKRIDSLEQALLHDYNLTLEEYFTPYELLAVHEIYYMTTLQGVIKIEKKVLVDKVKNSKYAPRDQEGHSTIKNGERAVTNAIRKLVQINQLHKGSLKSVTGGKGKYVLVDTQHNEFTSFLQYAYGLEQNEIELLSKYGISNISISYKEFLKKVEKTKEMELEQEQKESTENNILHQDTSQNTQQFTSQSSVKNPFTSRVLAWKYTSNLFNLSNLFGKNNNNIISNIENDIQKNGYKEIVQPILSEDAQLEYLERKGIQLDELTRLFLKFSFNSEEYMIRTHSHALTEVLATSIGNDKGNALKTFVHAREALKELSAAISNKRQQKGKKISDVVSYFSTIFLRKEQGKLTEYDVLCKEREMEYAVPENRAITEAPLYNWLEKK